MAAMQVIDGWYATIVAKTLAAKEADLKCAKSRCRLAARLHRSVQKDVRAAEKEVRRWQRKATEGRIHCPRLKALMSVAPMGVAPMGGAPMGVDASEDSSESTSSSEEEEAMTTSSSSASQSTASSSGDVSAQSSSAVVEVVVSQSTLASSGKVTEQERVEAQSCTMSDASFRSFLADCDIFD